jgi:predicted aspartyl protease
MQFNGGWYLCDDGIVRPIMRGDVLAGNGSWRAAEFLVDTGADRTVFSANVLEALALEATEAKEQIGGVGGVVDAVVVTTQIRLTRENANTVVFRGEYTACSNQEALDMSVLGRDILNMFAVIVDRTGNLVCLLGGRHRYRIEQR